MDLAASAGDESVSMAWLEDAIAHVHTHRQTRSLAYLEAVVEDEVFVMEMAELKKSLADG